MATMATTPQLLSDLPLFACLDRESRRAIAAHLQERRCTAGEVILWEGEPCQMAWFLAKGLVRSSRSSREGREHMLAYLGPGQPLNLISALDNGPNLATVVAATDATVYGVPRGDFWRIVCRHKELMQATLKSLAAEVRHRSDAEEELALCAARAHVAQFLLAQVVPGANRKRWTQGKIALHTGTRQEMVRRTLWAFAYEVLIRRERGRVVVVDQKALEQEAAWLQDCSRFADVAGVDGPRQVTHGGLEAVGHLVPVTS